MPYKNREEQLKAQQRHYQRNKDRYRQKAANWKASAWGGNRTTYDELAPLAPTLYDEVATQGYLTTVGVARKYDIAEVVVRNAATAGRIKYKRIGQIRAILPEDAEYWFNNIYKRRKATPTRDQRRHDIDESLKGRVDQIKQQTEIAVPLPQGEVTATEFLVAVATINKFAKQVATELSKRDKKISELERKLNRVKELLE